MRTELTTRIDRVEAKVDRVEAKVDGLAKSFPKIVGDEMRQALRERGL